MEKVRRREAKILYGRRLWELGEERLVKLIVEELKESGAWPAGGKNMRCCQESMAWRKMKRKSQGQQQPGRGK